MINIQVIRAVKVQCPRCGRIITAHQGHSDVECNCHLYCQYGTKPSDCTLVAASAGGDPFVGVWKWPSGLHNQESHEGDDTQARVYYCTTHNVYSSKVPMLISVDWSVQRYSNRKFRMSHGKY